MNPEFRENLATLNVCSPKLLGSAVPRPTMKIQDERSLDVVGAGGGIAGREMKHEGPLDLPEIGVGHSDGDGAGVSGVGLIRHLPAARGGCRDNDCV